MGARRFFVERTHALGDLVSIEGGDAHKLLHVLRARDGDEIELVDSAAQCFTATLRIDGEHVQALLAKLHATQTDATVTIDVAQGVPKGQKMDFVIEKLTELGVASIVPLVTERTVVRDAGASKLERWRRLARGAAQQCGRSDIPPVGDPIAFDALLARFSSYDAVLMPWEVAQARPPREMLPQLLAGARRVLVVIGPEGGFSHLEAERAAAAGAHLISLGRRILRTETAALVTVALIDYERA